MKLFLILIIYFLLNIILIMLLAYISSTISLLNAFRKDYSCTLFFKPIRLETFNSDRQLIEVVYKLFNNYIFSISYYRVALPGKYSKFNSFQALKVITIMSVLNIICFFIIYIKYLISFDKELKFTQFLYLNYSSQLDNRKIMFFDGKWHSNPNNKLDRLFEIFKPYILGDTKNKKSKEYVIKIFNDSIKSIKDDCSTKDKIKFKEIIHKAKEGYDDKSSLTRHLCTESISVRKETNLSIMTDFNSLLKNNFYNRNIDVINIMGPSKESTLLSLKKSDFISYRENTYFLKRDDICYSIYKSIYTNPKNELLYKGKFNSVNIAENILIQADKYRDAFKSFKYSIELVKFIDIPENDKQEAFNILFELSSLMDNSVDTFTKTVEIWIANNSNLF